MDFGHPTRSRVYTVADIGGLSRIAADYDGVMCDLWGTVHDGETPFAGAVEALQRYRAGGGVVVMLSNSPRTWVHIRRHLESMGLPRDCWDAIVTSGDVTVDMLCARLGTPIFHLGPERDLALYEAVESRTGVRPALHDARSAEMVVCTGTGGRDPASFEEGLRSLAARGLPMLCANPDLTARKGEGLTFCAGTLARRYLELGGSVSYAGKPYSAIYAKALSAIGEHCPSPRRVLAIGDSLETDILGAERQGWDAIHVVHAAHAVRAVHAPLEAGPVARSAAPRPTSPSPADVPEGLVW